MEPQHVKNATPSQPAKAQPAPAPKAPPEIDWSRPVPVAVVRFDRPVTYPGAQPSEYAKTTSQKDRDARPNGPTFDVEYLAPVRQFRITHTDISRNVLKVGYVPEARSLGWEPVQ